MAKSIILFFVIAFTLVTAITGKKTSQIQIESKSIFYLKDVLLSFTIILLIYMIDSGSLVVPDFEKTGTGFIISKDILSSIYPVFFLPLILSFTKYSPEYPKDINTTKELFGFPVQFLPNNQKEFFLFTLYIIAGVLFEETFCRIVMFNSFNFSFNLKGDLLILTVAFLFSVGHYYQGWKGMTFMFLVGFIWGKIFALTGTVLYPIILHLAINLTIVVLSYRRMKDLKLL